MSHVATIDLEIKDLEALAVACRSLGLELVRGQRTYRWFGQRVGDYPLPAGFTADELGRCEHAIRIPGQARAYEIGVVRRRDGRPGHTLLWDSWNGGYGLVEQVGGQAEKLKHAYEVQASLRAAQRLGHRLLEQTQLEDGTVVLQHACATVGGAFGWPKLITKIGARGELSLEVKGVQGAGCQALTKPLEDALGLTTADRKTADYYQTQHVHGHLRYHG